MLRLVSFAIQPIMADLELISICSIQFNIVGYFTFIKQTEEEGREAEVATTYQTR